MADLTYAYLPNRKTVMHVCLRWFIILLFLQDHMCKSTLLSVLQFFVLLVVLASKVIA